jgi:predicted Zn-dependent protease with MMP-like domain
VTGAAYPGTVRRDRRGRGLRGSLAPAGLPIAVSPSDRFDALAADAVEHVESRWREQLADVEFAVDLVPAVDGEPLPDGVEVVESAGVPLARVFPREGSTAPHLVLYRKPIELRCADGEDLEDLVHDVVVQLVASYLGLDPEVVDPGFTGPDGDAGA